MPEKLRAIYGAAWSITVLMLLIDWIWAYRIGFQVEPGSVAQAVIVTSGVIAMTASLWVISRIPYKSVARQSFYQHAAHLFMWITVLVGFTHVCLVFQYLCVTTDFPLVTNVLISADAALGFHWPDIYQWVEAHHWIRFSLELAYASGNFQIFAIPVILALTLNSQDYAEFVLQFLASATLAILIAVPFPTESAFLHFDVHDPYTVSTVSDYFLLRSGHARELAFTSAQGLISFPSLHAMLALYFAYSLRHVRLVFPIGVALNVLMILSTPTQGGHYLFDVLSGLIAGVLVIYFVRWLIRRSAPLSREVPSTVNPQDAPPAASP